MSDNLYQVSPLAGEDLDGIWVYTYETWSREQADHYYSLLINAFELLGRSPEKGQDVGHVRAGYMRYSVKKHYIFYKIMPKGGIKVVRILGQVMDITRHL